MYIKIHQINIERDKKRTLGLGLIMRDSKVIDKNLYDVAWEGNVECNNLEDIWRIFNIERPEDYKGRSLSISDIVEVIEDEQSKFYFCDNRSWEELETVESWRPKRNFSLI